MINSNVVLIAIRVLPISNGCVYPFNSPEPAMAGHVQAVAGRCECLLGCTAARGESRAAVREVVWQRHSGDEPLEPCLGMYFKAMLIVIEHTDRFKGGFVQAYMSPRFI